MQAEGLVRQVARRSKKQMSELIDPFASKPARKRGKHSPAAQKSDQNAMKNALMVIV